MAKVGTTAAASHYARMAMKRLKGVDSAVGACLADKVATMRPTTICNKRVDKGVMKIVLHPENYKELGELRDSIIDSTPSESKVDSFVGNASDALLATSLAHYGVEGVQAMFYLKDTSKVIAHFKKKLTGGYDVEASALEKDLTDNLSTLEKQLHSLKGKKAVATKKVKKDEGSSDSEGSGDDE